MNRNKEYKVQKEVLVIEDNEKVNLPNIYHKVNNLCAVIYDQLTEIYKLDNYSTLLSTTLTNVDGKKLSNELKNGEINILDWLKENDEIELLTDSLTKHLTMSIVSDFINFMYEALRNAKNGKMTVAYALLRKPLTDELLILEQLFINKEDFINRFFNDGEIKNYDPSSRTINKEDIIKKAVNKLNIKSVFPPEAIYELRYDKSCENGLNGITNHALHIVTNDSRYRTENQNFNFIFSVEKDIEDYRKHFYSFVPYLLIYSVSIIDGIIFDLLKDDSNQNLKNVKELRRLVGIFLLNFYKKNLNKQEVEKMFKELGEGMKYICSNCNHENNFQYTDFNFFFETETFICQNCHSNLLNDLDSIEPIKGFFDMLNNHY